MMGRLDPADRRDQAGDDADAAVAARTAWSWTRRACPFVVLFGTNKVARLDPETMAVTGVSVAGPEPRPRRIAITSDDMIWYADYSRGYLGRLDPRTGAVKEWPSPERCRVAAVRHRRRQGHHLVQRIRRQAEHARALRSEDREVPELDHSLGRHRRPQHDGDERGQSRAGVQRSQSRGAGRGQVALRRFVGPAQRFSDGRPDWQCAGMSLTA